MGVGECDVGSTIRRNAGFWQGAAIIDDEIRIDGCCAAEYPSDIGLSVVFTDALLIFSGLTQQHRQSGIYLENGSDRVSAEGVRR